MALGTHNGACYLQRLPVGGILQECPALGLAAAILPDIAVCITFITHTSVPPSQQTPSNAKAALMAAVTETCPWVPFYPRVYDTRPRKIAS